MLFCSHVEKRKKRYYDVYTLVEKNEGISSVLNLTPFLVYFIESVYNHLETKMTAAKTAGEFTKLLEDGKITGFCCT